ncbi:aspartate 1-decarboxylase [Alkalihalobacillus trypoxylicola]|uniref:Aspartate 1-decarboxylase n=1 Tax=Alkalihalobacillus trypoxylicola TaxID=519424 RepID=A0A161Q7N4_9BACI|nr:aspartate 1-decarboxylase [Alkalihalobacillus trypoxylicola]KYG32889.1 aspartate decarboxylase [Alkalihalobacillus trypoxylicola]
MLRHMMRAKLHKATVTESNLHYVGSITIDENLMDAVGILENEKVQIVNNNNGSRFETYVIKGERGSGVCCLNGAAARLVHQGDTVIIIAYGLLDEEELKQFQPKVAVLGENNKILEMLGTEPASTVL